MKSRLAAVCFLAFLVFSASLQEALVVSNAWSRGRVVEVEPVFFRGKKVGFLSRLDRGFIILPASRRLPPIKLYSTLPYDPSNPVVKYVLWELFVEQEEIQKTPEFKALLDRRRGVLAWVALRDGKISSPVSRNPLIKTRWDQDYPYNYYAPVLNGKKTYAGCVAVAFGQIMKYWEWPKQGRGSHAYKWKGRVLSASFSVSYPWRDMPLRLLVSSPLHQIKAVGLLLYHLGVGFEMDYGTEGSSAYASDATGVLPRYFRYSSGIKYLSRSSMTSQQWYRRMMWERDLRRPFEFTVCSEDVCHAVVVDGYTKTEHEFLVHINFGWSGYFDGYYSPDNIEAGYSFTKTEWQEMVVAIFPAPKIFPPDGLMVVRHQDRGIFLRRYVDKITLERSPSREVSVSSYRLYRNAGGDIEMVWEGGYTPVVEVVASGKDVAYAASVVGKDGRESPLTPWVSPDAD